MKIEIEKRRCACAAAGVGAGVCILASPSYSHLALPPFLGYPTTTTPTPLPYPAAFACRRTSMLMGIEVESESELEKRADEMEKTRPPAPLPLALCPPAQTARTRALHDSSFPAAHTSLHGNTRVRTHPPHIAPVPVPGTRSSTPFRDPPASLATTHDYDASSPPLLLPPFTVPWRRTPAHLACIDIDGDGRVEVEVEVEERPKMEIGIGIGMTVGMEVEECAQMRMAYAEMEKGAGVGAYIGPRPRLPRLASPRFALSSAGAGVLLASGPHSLDGDAGDVQDTKGYSARGQVAYTAPLHHLRVRNTQIRT
ncbi:hypothetical protein B0H13DRAFT_2672481 [Mycena leptocephala]|nr:hypothetical protein B0H13DRAFT_2672481 [Mycena leptocephala]